MNDLATAPQPEPERDVPEVGLADAVETLLSNPNTASKRWVYRQYDHEVQLRTAVRPGDDAALLAVREAGVGVALSSGAEPNWTDAAPYEGARAVALENATNVAAKGATPLAAVDCLNGGNPEKPGVYGGFADVVDGLAEMCSTLGIPVVGGNVSLYNDSPSGPIPPTPTLAVVGTKDGYDAPGLSLSGEGELLVVGDPVLAGDTEPRLGGSEFLATFGGSDGFPELPAQPGELIDAVATVADLEGTLATHDVSHGGLAVSLAEMVTEDAGATVTLDGDARSLLVHEQPGRVVVETTAPEAVREAVDGVAPVTAIGAADSSGTLTISAESDAVEFAAGEIAEQRDVIRKTLE